MQGLYKAPVVLDETVTERKLDLNLLEKINNRVPKDVTTSIVFDDNVRPELGDPDRPYAKEILDTISGKLVAITEKLTDCEETKDRDIPVITAARRLIGWDVVYEAGQLLTLPGATTENIDGPISVMITGELANYMEFAYNMDNYEGGQYSIIFTQDMNRPGVITGQIYYVWGEVYAVTDITFNISDPKIEVDAEDYYRITVPDQYFDITINADHLYEPMEYELQVVQTTLEGYIPPVQIIPQPGWDEFTGGVLRIQFVGDTFLYRTVMNLVITSSGLERRVEVGSSGQKTAVLEGNGGAVILGKTEDSIGIQSYVFGFTDIPTTERFDLFTVDDIADIYSVTWTPLPVTSPWSSLLVTSPPNSPLTFEVTYTPVTPEIVSSNVDIKVETVENDRYPVEISALFVGSHEVAGIRIDPEESVGNEFAEGDVISFQVTTNSTGTPSYSLDSSLSPYFTVEPGAGWSEFGVTSFTATLLLRVTSPVPTSGIDGLLSVSMTDINTLTSTARIEGVGIGDDVPVLIVESNPYYHMINVGDTWQIPVTGRNLTSEIELAVPGPLTPYLSLTKSSNWNNLTGGVLTLTCTNLPTTRLVDTVRVYSVDDEVQFEVGFSGTAPIDNNPNLTVSENTPYNFGELTQGETASVTVTANLIGDAATNGGYLTWQANASADPLVNSVTLLKHTTSDQHQIDMYAAFTPTTVGAHRRETTIRVFIDEDDRYPFTYPFVFIGKYADPELYIEPETYTNLSYDGSRIPFVITGINLVGTITYSLLSSDGGTPVSQFSIEEDGGWSGKEGGTLYLTFDGVPYEGEVNLILRVTSVQDDVTADSEVRLQLERALEVNRNDISNTDWDYTNSGELIQVVGLNLTEDIQWEVSSPLSSYIDVQAGASFDYREGGTLYLTGTRNFDTVSGTITVTSGNLVQIITVNLSSGVQPSFLVSPGSPSGTNLNTTANYLITGAGSVTVRIEVRHPRESMTLIGSGQYATLTYLTRDESDPDLYVYTCEFGTSTVPAYSPTGPHIPLRSELHVIKRESMESIFTAAILDGVFGLALLSITPQVSPSDIGYRSAPIDFRNVYRGVNQIDKEITIARRDSSNQDFVFSLVDFGQSNDYFIFNNYTSDEANNSFRFDATFLVDDPNVARANRTLRFTLTSPTYYVQFDTFTITLTGTATSFPTNYIYSSDSVNLKISEDLRNWYDIRNLPLPIRGLRITSGGYNEYSSLFDARFLTNTKLSVSESGITWDEIQHNSTIVTDSNLAITPDGTRWLNSTNLLNASQSYLYTIPQSGDGIQLLNQPQSEEGHFIFLQYDVTLDKVVAIRGLKVYLIDYRDNTYQELDYSSAELNEAGLVIYQINSFTGHNVDSHVINIRSTVNQTTSQFYEVEWDTFKLKELVSSGTGDSWVLSNGLDAIVYGSVNNRYYLGSVILPGNDVTMVGTSDSQKGATIGPDGTLYWESSTENGAVSTSVYRVNSLKNTVGRLTANGISGRNPLLLVKEGESTNTVSVKEVELEYTVGSYYNQISFTNTLLGNITWNAPYWVDVVQENNGRCSVTANSTNSSIHRRGGTVYFYEISTNRFLGKVIVRQKGAPIGLTIDKSGLDSFKALSGDVKEVIVTSALPITAQLDSTEYFTLLSNVNNNDGTHTIRIVTNSVNPTDSQRLGSFTVSNGIESEVVDIVQSASPILLSTSSAIVGALANSTATISIAGGTRPFTLRGESSLFNYEIPAVNEIRITALETNLTTSPIVTYSTLIDSEGYERDFSVTQEQATILLIVDPEESVIPALGGSTTHTITNRGGNVTVKSAPDWVTTEISGDTLTITASYNADPDNPVERTGSVVLTNELFAEATVTVTQDWIDGSIEILTSPIIGGNQTHIEPESNIIVKSALPIQVSVSSSHSWGVTGYNIGNIIDNEDGTFTVPVTYSDSTDEKLTRADITISNAVSNAEIPAYGYKSHLSSSRPKVLLGRSLNSSITIGITGAIGNLSVSKSDSDTWYTASVNNSSKTITLRTNSTNNGQDSARLSNLYITDSGAAGTSRHYLMSVMQNDGTSSTEEVGVPLTIDMPALGGTVPIYCQGINNTVLSTADASGYTTTYNNSTGHGTITAPANNTTESTFKIVRAVVGNNQPGHAQFQITQLPVVNADSGSFSSNEKYLLPTADFFLIDVETEGSWLVSSNVDWCTCFEIGGNGNRTLVFFYDAIEPTDIRTGTITLTGTGWSDTCTVTQYGDSSLRADYDSIPLLDIQDAPSILNRVTVTLETRTELGTPEVIGESGWIGFEKHDDFNGSTQTVDVIAISANTATEPRESSVRFTNQAGTSVTIPVTQLGINGIYIDKEYGEVIEFGGLEDGRVIDTPLPTPAYIVNRRTILVHTSSALQGIDGTHPGLIIEAIIDPSQFTGYSQPIVLICKSTGPMDSGEVTGDLSVSNEGGGVVKIPIKQLPYTTESSRPSVNPTTYYLGSEAGNFAIDVPYIGLYTTGIEKIDGKPTNWLNLSVSAATGPLQGMYFTCKENTTGEIRKASLRVSNGGPYAYCTVIQSTYPDGR